MSDRLSRIAVRALAEKFRSDAIQHCMNAHWHGATTIDGCKLQGKAAGLREASDALYKILERKESV